MRLLFNAIWFIKRVLQFFEAICFVVDCFYDFFIKLILTRSSVLIVFVGITSLHES